jgi:hypothetical protein
LKKINFKDKNMLKKTVKLLAGVAILTSLSLATEPGSGYYAKDCAHPGGGYNIVISKDGTAMVESDPEVYKNVLTSYSFFGKDTPSDFLIAIMFDAKHSPLPKYKGQDGWIEIWKKGNSYYALENGRASKELQLCSKTQ